MERFRKFFTSKLSVFKKKFNIVLLVIVTILLFYDKVTVNWDIAKSGTFTVLSNDWMYVFIFPFIFVLFLTSLSMQYDENYTYRVNDSLKTKIEFWTKSIFTLVMSIGFIFLLSISVGKLTWVIAGGLWMEKDLIALETICSPKSTTDEISSIINEIHPCLYCAESVIVFDTDIRKLEDYESSNYLSEVQRISQAKYVACINSHTESKMCNYEGGHDEMILYEEEVTVQVFSLVTGKQQGAELSLTADIPPCPGGIFTSNGLAKNFEHFIDISRELVYKKIEKTIP